ncbi:MAG: LysR family transcriptional regulator [Solirubrobacterales bacterium]
MDWENLKFFLAVAREGTLAGAGRALAVKHSTVLRRIAAFESSLGIRLFDRNPTGYALTDAGRELLEGARRVEEDLSAIERRLSGRDLRLTGNVRIATLPVLSPWVCDAVAGFRKLHPGITVEVETSADVVSLPRHEADIALRVTRKPPDSLVGRRVATLAHGVYAARSHPAAAMADLDPQAHEWIGHDESRAETPQAQWLRANVPDGRVVFRTNATATMVSAVRAGIGLAVLPCYLGDGDPSLRRLQLIRGLGMEMWLLTHRDLRRTPRVKALVTFMAKRLAQYRAIIEGGVADAPN